MFHQVVLVLVVLAAGCGGGSGDMGPSRGMKPVDLPPITYEAGADLGGDLRSEDPPDAGAADVLAADGPPAPPPDAAPLAADGPPALPPDAAPPPPDAMPAYPQCVDPRLRSIGQAAFCRDQVTGRRRRTVDGLLCVLCETTVGCWTTPESLKQNCPGTLYYCATGCLEDPKCRDSEPFVCK